MCRERRHFCGTERPQCRNCIHHKRVCGYDQPLRFAPPRLDFESRNLIRGKCTQQILEDGLENVDEKLKEDLVHIYAEDGWPDVARDSALSRDSHEVLGISGNADLARIQSAYRDCLLRCFSSRYTTDLSEYISDMLTIKRAYDALKDPAGRATYDARPKACPMA